MPAFVRLRRSKRVRIHPKPFLIFFTNSSYEVRHSRQHRLDNAFRRFTIDLPSRRNCIRRVSSNNGTSCALDTSDVVTSPFIPIRSSSRLRRHVARAVTNFFAAPLRRYPYGECGNFTRTSAHLPSMQIARCTQPCTIVVHVRRLSHFSAAETTTPACCGRRSLPNGDRCAARANQKVSQSSAPPVAAACAGAAAAATGLRTGAAAAARFGWASRSSRAAATGAATAAEDARGA